MSQPRGVAVTYNAPPLVEVAMSIQFEPSRELNSAHLGAFWMTQRHQLPIVRTLQPIPAVSDDFGGAGQWLPPALQFALKSEPDCRLQMVSSDDQWMCQLQRNRIVINWRRRNEQYPRFDTTLARFRDGWNSWRIFLKDIGLPPTRPQIWELTYVNRVAQGELWARPGDWHRIFPGLWGGPFAGPADSQLRGFHGQWVWESRDPLARLYIEPQPGRSSEPPHHDELILSLTARGPFALSATEDNSTVESEMSRIEAGLVGGNALIVSAFDGMTSDAAKTNWGRHANHE